MPRLPMRPLNKALALLLCASLLLFPASAEEETAPEPEEPQPIIVVEEEPVPETTPVPEEPVTPDETAAPIATPKPTATRDPDAGPALLLTVAGGTEDENHVWHLTLPTDGQLVLRWSLSGAQADSYFIVFFSPSLELAEETEASSYSISAAQLASGRCTVAVTALIGAETMIAELVLDLTVSDEALPTLGPTAEPSAEPTATPRPTSRIPSRQPSAGAKATATPSKYGSVTPGKALLSSHASGSGILQGLESGWLRVRRIEGQTILMLDSEELEISCGETNYTMNQTGEILELTAVTEAPAWRLTLQDLETLADHGIRVLALVSSDGQRRLNTRQLLNGSAYTRERMDGFVPQDFVYRWTDEGWRVEVEERVYALERGRLVRINQ